MTIRDRVELDAILGGDVAHLIEQLGLRKEFESGDCHCCVCNDVVNYTNLKLLFPMADRKVGFLCNKPRCFVEFALKE